MYLHMNDIPFVFLIQSKRFKSMIVDRIIPGLTLPNLNRTTEISGQIRLGTRLTERCQVKDNLILDKLCRKILISL